MSLDFSLPIGSHPKDPAGYYETVRQKAKEFWELTDNKVINVRQFITTENPTSGIQEALEYCRTNGYDLSFEEKEYVITETLQIKNVRIHGNKATFVSEVPAGVDGDMPSGVVMSSAGTRGDAFSLDADIKEADRYIKISNATFLSSLSPGDLVHIVSSKDFYPGEGKQGEIQQVHTVEAWGIYIYGYMFDTYLLSDSPTIRKMDKTTCYVDNLTIINNKTNISERLTGISASYNYFPVIKNVVLRNIYQRGIGFGGCFSPYLTNFIINGSNRNGFGYGVNISSGTMYSTVENGLILGSRHCISHGGGVDGVPWDSYVKNVRGSANRFDGVSVFDAHRSTGSVIWESCMAFGGREEKDDLSLYSALSEYNTGDAAYSEDGDVYYSLTDSNIGNALSSLTYWLAKPGEGHQQGFNLRGRRVHILNCRAYNMAAAIIGTGAEIVDYVIIEGLQSINCRRAIIMNTSNIKSLTVKGIRHKRNVPSTEEAINIQAVVGVNSIDHLVMQDIEVINQPVMRLEVGIDVEMKDIRGWLGTTHTDTNGIIMNCIGNVVMKNIVLSDYDVPVLFGQSSNVNIELTANNFLLYGIRVEGNINSLIFNATLRTPRTTMFAAYFRENVGSVLLNSVGINSDNSIYLIRTLVGKTFDVLNIGNIQIIGSGSFVRMVEAAKTDPAIIILKGSDKDILDCIVQATPEGSVIARIGAIARDNVNGKVYFKATGTGNTGWREIQFV